jgi:nucleotide-binding universal stress UspA family protein
MPATRTAVLLCVGTQDARRLVERATPYVAVDRSLVLLHVIDVRPIEHLDHARHRLRPGTRPRDREARMEVLGEEAAERLLIEAAERCGGLGYDLKAVTRQVASGHPEREIVRLAGRLGVGLVVLGASERRPEKPVAGPGSIGHVARYVLDHAPCDVLLLR